MIKKYRKLLLAVVVLLFAGLLGWNIYLQRELYKYKPRWRPICRRTSMWR